MAILVPRSILIAGGVGEASSRLIRATLPLSRNVAIHVFSAYLYGTSYPDRDKLNAKLLQEAQGTIAGLGRVPWIFWGRLQSGTCQRTARLASWRLPL